MVNLLGTRGRVDVNLDVDVQSRAIGSRGAGHKPGGRNRLPAFADYKPRRLPRQPVAAFADYKPSPFPGQPFAAALAAPGLRDMAKLGGRQLHRRPRFAMG